MWRDSTAAVADLVKGLSTMNFDPTTGRDAPLTRADVTKYAAEAYEALKASRSSMAKSIAPEMGGLAMFIAQQAGLNQQAAELRKMLADLSKTEISSTYPISGSATIYGLAVYDLQAPSHIARATA